jgi:hypothetical protein
MFRCLLDINRINYTVVTLKMERNTLLRLIQNRFAFALRIFDSVGSAAAGFGQVADADVAIVYKVSVPSLHTAPIIMLRKAYTRFIPFLEGNENVQTQTGLHILQTVTSLLLVYHN